MKPFDLEKALQGEPVKLHNGCKAYIVYRVPDKYYDYPEHSYPLVGFSLTRDGKLANNGLTWTIDGEFNLTVDFSPTDIVGMWD